MVALRTRPHPGFARTAHVCATFLQSLLQLRDWTASMLCSPSDLPAKGFSNQIPLVTRGNCTFYEKVRLAQGSGARGLLIVSKETLVQPPGCPSWALGTLGDSCPAGQQDLPGARVGGREEPEGLSAMGLDGHGWGRRVQFADHGCRPGPLDRGLEGDMSQSSSGAGGYGASERSSGGTFWGAGGMCPGAGLSFRLS